MVMRLFSARETKERAHRRMPTFAVVEILALNGAMLERATVRDISKKGALLRLVISQPLPDSILIWFPADRLEIKATIRWRREDSIGVEFDGEIELPARLTQKKGRAEVVASHFQPAHVR
jgi:hypothetical protein